MKIKLTPFEKSDFERLISWITNEETLVTIAGLDFKYPLDNKQLSNYLDEPESQAFNVVLMENEIIGHAEIIRTGSKKCLLDKIIIGENDYRGKGIGEQLTRELLNYAFDIMDVDIVELNVYDWNHSAIRCYKKVGFVKSPSKEQITKFRDKNWQYFSMIIDKKNWKSKG